MSNLKIKKNNNIKVASRISNYLDSEFCYMPILNNYELLVDINEKVLKNQPIMKSDDNYIISSPISGKTVAIEQVKTINGKVSAIVIKNDFKEKIISSKGINNDFTKYNNLDLNNIMRTCGVSYYDAKPEFFSFKTEKQKYLLIDAVENEPYVANYSLLLSTKLEDILEAIDSISRLLQIDNVFIVVNDIETDIINHIYDLLGTFANFKLKLVNNNYPTDIKKVLPSNVDENDVLKINLTTLLAIDVAFKKERNVTSKLITVTGDLVDKPKVVLVKIGSNIKDIIEANIKINKSDNPIYVANGLLTGRQLNNLDLIVTPDLSSIIIMEKVVYLKKDCINCGACLKVCPIKNNVKYTNDFPNAKSSIKQIEDCTNCNACTYICPVNTNFSATFNKDENKQNDILIHSDNSIQKINYRFLVSLLPLIIFGLYKNGLLVYLKEYTTFVGMLKPLFIIVISFIIGYVIAFIINKFHYHQEGGVLANYHLPIMTLIIGMLVPIKINIFIYLPILIIITSIYFRFIQRKKFSINFVSFMLIIMILITYFMGTYTSLSQIYLNNYELSANLNPSVFRLLIGYNYGGLAVTNVLLIIFSYIYLSFSISYKKEIPFYIFLFYLTFAIISLIFYNDFNGIIRSMMSSSFAFILVYVATDSKNSPYNNLGMIIYSFAIALISFILSIYYFELSLYIAILLVSTFTFLLDKVFRKTKF